ncbi:TraR/DksA family transcriptional regulator [Panacagrimonas perspica]|uniref:TraR/DksA family transcriptional regulator n=1 Tax=Panacagrimonas perspica TaxID=381431 RepID=A0A4S3K502_9GAMM|nr:RNA polymerase-binding protein DksA [Panacagrimonas perspica]TDU31603.1 TraR/DksA family transcriptional regulator [Panacagrimonas perspica]THD03169.1 RNA polymerase-binding protein DksA [Panacagrimonas perspica]
MAKSTPKKKAAPAAKRPAPKPVAKKAAAKPKPAAKKVAPAKKVASKPAPKAKPVAKAKPAPKPVPKAKPVAKAKPAKPVAKPKSTQMVAPKPAAKRPVAVSHRPQASAVAVQARPTKPAATPVRQRSVELPSGVSLSEDQIRRAPESAYMNDNQLSFFQERLLQMRGEVLARELDVKERLHQREVFADPADRASAEEEHWLDLRLRERESLLLKKIDDALRRIRDREYGYCEKTGEAIGIARLLARPTATVCVDIKGQDERAESQYRDR